MDGGGISSREGVLNLSRTKDIYVIGIAAGLSSGFSGFRAHGRAN